MLSNDEKTKIELEEQYRIEVSSKIKSKPRIDLVEKFTKILQGVAIIIGILATYYEYRKQNEARIQQERDRYEQTAKEFRKYFYQKQMDYYLEATEVTATLATEDINSVDYKKSRKDFFRLFWGKLSIVEDKSVEARMVQFKYLLLEFENNPQDSLKKNLEQASLSLARDARQYTINVWVDSTERNNFNR